VRVAQIGSSFPELLKAWEMRCVLRGKEVSLMAGDEVKRGTVVGLSPGGELILMTASGRESLLQASEIRVIGE
jgi:biotin-(acetyl-CoA carboxylase) ligase